MGLVNSYGLKEAFRKFLFKTKRSWYPGKLFRQLICSFISGAGLSTWPALVEQRVGIHPENGREVRQVP